MFLTLCLQRAAFPLWTACSSSRGLRRRPATMPSWSSSGLSSMWVFNGLLQTCSICIDHTLLCLFPGCCGEDRLHPSAPVSGSLWMETDVRVAHTYCQDKQVLSCQESLGNWFSITWTQRRLITALLIVLSETFHGSFFLGLSLTVRCGLAGQMVPDLTYCDYVLVSTRNRFWKLSPSPTKTWWLLSCSPSRYWTLADFSASGDAQAA